MERWRPGCHAALGADKKFDLDQELVPVLADPTQLELAVLNLAINARDAMPEGGLLSITTRPVAIKGDPEMEPGDYLELCIGDTGTGMPEEVVARAFEPFTTKEIADPSRTSGVLLALSCDSPANVDSMVERAVAAGGTARPVRAR